MIDLYDFVKKIVILKLTLCGESIGSTPLY